MHAPPLPAKRLSLWMAQAAADPGATSLSPACCEPDAAAVQLGARSKLADLDPHLHCSVIGTCLSVGELRKLMARAIEVKGLSDLEVHHEAVRLTSQQPELAKQLHKALDRRHEATLQRFARAKEPEALGPLWDAALAAGEVPGAYWAVLTHRRCTPELRQRVFGDVHMLSHLVGAANRADIRRLVALERENDALRERLERAQERGQALVEERERLRAEHERGRDAPDPPDPAPAANDGRDGDAAAAQALVRSLENAVALQTERREAAETQAQAQWAEAQRLGQTLQLLQARTAELACELAAAERQLQARAAADAPPLADAGGAGRSTPLHAALAGKRLLYVGGRPSTLPAIRALAMQAGAELKQHDGGIEHRKAWLGAALSWSDLVLFPVDCIDHDSALALKRDCSKVNRPFIALRTASVASFISAVSAWATSAAEPLGHDAGNGFCRRHA